MKHDTPVKRMAFKNRRKFFNLTQREVANAVGVTENHIRHIEAGRANPDAKLLFKLVKYLKTTAEELFPDLAEVEIEPAGSI
ncbi:helix-turn-helix transcriptional regulator [Paenibacillus polymyxa]|uniref:Dna-binding protein n=1 Tax=Paenibacillus polymyxa TaxID=1406 RepID=A0A378XUI1_PAEPO|nr:helix-turn-helix transcriptional regulator [Paenibacillus polymyxa]AHM65113.1 hypothetical protein PPSQR21_014610 [Paenibacillus polymyxa SQR-21]MBG9763130.1 XRE family transcriptional regulator [Paenibacillus polymyxa]MBG9766416.1 XRE family transcriptional regulator [Paenibacillus polymyxa]MCC3257464.1 helix-turn-helix domain-containing protein [Paenibacillus polymyxa]SUA68185.1 dna-binding protein [Paenibacillus polymyxa]